MFDEIKRIGDFLHWCEEKHPEVLRGYEEEIKSQK
jgi:hypothetical protein